MSNDLIFITDITNIPLFQYTILRINQQLYIEYFIEKKDEIKNGDE